MQVLFVKSPLLFNPLPINGMGVFDSARRQCCSTTSSRENHVTPEDLSRIFLVTAKARRNFTSTALPVFPLFPKSVPVQVHPRSKNSINNTGIGTPKSHNSAQPTLPSSSFCFLFSSQSFITFSCELISARSCSGSMAPFLFPLVRVHTCSSENTLNKTIFQNRSVVSG